MSNQHPLVLELNSLRAAFEQYQHAAHVASIQLQRARLEASEASAQAKILEAENDRLRHEVAFLRGSVEPSQSSRQVTDLSLALRRASDKISLTEEALLKKTTELTHCISENHKLQFQLKAALASVDSLRRAGHEPTSREIELERRCKAAEEEARMADTVVMEYADLVRSLEQRLSQMDSTKFDPGHDVTNVSNGDGHNSTYSNGTAKPADGSTPLQSLAENRASLQRLLHEFNAESGRLQDEVSRLHGELSKLQNTLDAERVISNTDRGKLAEALTQLEFSKVDDTSASRIVSRYMKFSQSSIDTLQSALSTVKARHATSLSTLTASCESLGATLDLERKRAARLRDAMDQLTEDVSRETFGRRREVALKLRCLVREERTFESLRAWVRRAEESRIRLAEESSTFSDRLSMVLDKMLEEARNVLSTLLVEGETFKADSWARVALAEQTCTSLVAELNKETQNRVELAKLLTLEPKIFTGEELPSAPHSDVQDRQDQETTPEPTSSDAVDFLPAPEEEHQAPKIPFPPAAEPEDTPGPANIPLQAVTGIQCRKQDTIDFRPESSDDAPLIPVVAEVAVERNTVGFSPTPSAEVAEDDSHHLQYIFQRYEQLQKSFRDCHIALSSLKDRIASEKSQGRHIALVQNVVLRLDDFCEDARVELDIRIADEERMAQGFKMMLGLSNHDEGKTQQDYESFKEGTTYSIVKAREGLESKLADLEHDIAQIKRVLDEEDPEPETPASSLSARSPNWASWTQPFLSSSPTTPPPPAPTFGSVITSPKLRRTTSNASIMSNASQGNNHDPYVRFGLRISMPIYSHAAPQRQRFPSLSWNPSSPKGRTGRTSSAMYLLGLAGSASTSLLPREDPSESPTDVNQNDIE